MRERAFCPNRQCAISLIQCAIQLYNIIRKFGRALSPWPSGAGGRGMPGALPNGRALRAALACMRWQGEGAAMLRTKIVCKPLELWNAPCKRKQMCDRGGAHGIMHTDIILLSAPRVC